MKDCWKILGIEKTKDVQKIKKAYRELIKRYHPDTVRSPEKIRRYTIKAVEIMQAYKQAIEYANSHESVPKPRTVKGATSDKKISRAKSVFFSVLLLALIIGLPFGFFKFLMDFPKWLTSLPFDSSIRMIISGLIAIPLGIGFGFVLSLFTSPLLLIPACLDDTRFSSYMWKIYWVALLIGNILIVYCTDFHWPFEHRTNDYYNFFYHICRITAWAYVPFGLLIYWLKEQINYLRVKDYRIVSLSEIESF